MEEEVEYELKIENEDKSFITDNGDGTFTIQPGEYYIGDGEDSGVMALNKAITITLLELYRKAMELKNASK